MIITTDYQGKFICDRITKCRNYLNGYILNKSTLDYEIVIHVHKNNVVSIEIDLGENTND